eukprot:15433919-Alexandrium_andersonii.AAC.1
MPKLPTKQAGRHAGGASRVGSGGAEPPWESLGLRNGISVEPNRPTKPNTTETEPTEPSTSMLW